MRRHYLREGFLSHRASHNIQFNSGMQNMLAAQDLDKCPDKLVEISRKDSLDEKQESIGGPIDIEI